jgi:quinol-cytochrome oxidoreductase complex cytochrome b subunit
MGASIGILFLLPSLDKGEFNLLQVCLQLIVEGILVKIYRRLYRKLLSKYAPVLHEIYIRADLFERNIERAKYSNKDISSGAVQRLYKGPRFRPLFKFFFSFWVFNFLFLGCLGGKPVEFPYSELSVFVSFFYFSYFFIYF